MGTVSTQIKYPLHNKRERKRQREREQEKATNPPTPVQTGENVKQIHLGQQDLGIHRYIHLLKPTEEMLPPSLRSRQ